MFRIALHLLAAPSTTAFNPPKASSLAAFVPVNWYVAGPTRRRSVHMRGGNANYYQNFSGNKSHNSKNLATNQMSSYSKSNSEHFRVLRTDLLWRMVCNQHLILDYFMSNKKINKHGLNRYVPEDIRQQIRKESGYGCVICGSMFCDYEHIDPEFNDAKSHDPACMTLLCEGCHGRVTGKRKSKRVVWKAKEEPFAIKHGFVKELLEPAIEETINLGNSVIDTTQVAVEIYGKPILWFEQPSQPDEPILVNAIFYSNNSEPLAFINRNQFTAKIGGADIKSEGTTIEFRPKPRHISLVLNVEGDKPISVERLDMSYLNVGFKILANRSMLMRSGDSSVSINQMTVKNCGGGIALGEIPKTRRLPMGTVNKIQIAYSIARYEKKLVSCNGEHLGWVSSHFIVNKQYDFVGNLDVDDNDILITRSITGEFIGYLYQDSKGSFSVEMEHPEYDTYEPIWISPQSIQSKYVRKRGEIDLSHRFFGMKFRPVHFNASTNENHEPLQATNNNSVHPKPYSSCALPIDFQDRVTIDLIGYMEGYEFEGGRADNFIIEVGAGRMIPGFEEGLLGHKKGDRFELHVTFPNDYHAASFRNKDVIFKINIIDVERRYA